jgi:lipopolysaccharide export system protein LptA
MTVTGNAVLREGANVIRGDRVVVFLEENRGVVYSGKNKRVTATVYPGEKQDSKP